jgi:hypothetical protein
LAEHFDSLPYLAPPTSLSGVMKLGAFFFFSSFYKQAAISTVCLFHSILKQVQLTHHQFIQAIFQEEEEEENEHCWKNNKTFQ